MRKIFVSSCGISFVEGEGNLLISGSIDEEVDLIELPNITTKQWYKICNSKLNDKKLTKIAKKFSI